MLESYQISVPHRNKSLVFGNTGVGKIQASDEQKKKKVVGIGGSYSE